MKPTNNLLLIIALAMVGCSGDREATVDEPAAVTAYDLRESVSRMAAVGWANSATFSADGSRVAYVSSETGVPQVWVTDLATGERRQVTSFEDQVTGVQWSPAADRLAVSVAPGGGLNTQLYLIDLGNEGAEPLMFTAGGRVNNWLTVWSNDGNFLTYSSNAAGDGSMDSYVYDLASAESRMLADNDGIGFTFHLSPNDERAVVWRMQSRGNTDLYLVDVDSGGEQLLTPHEGVALSDYAQFADDNTILVATNIDREMLALGRIDIDEDGNAGPVRIVAERDDAELEEFQLTDNGVLLMWNAAGKSELAWFDLDAESMAAGPGLPAEIGGAMVASADGGHVALTMSGAATPQNIWHLEVSTGDMQRVSDSAHEGVDLDGLVRPELVRYTAHDDLELTGWLYLPADAELPIPIVTSFHGGPEGQERPRFRSTYQALLSRGIGVFAPNVRGSSGFGKTFVNLDNGALRVNGVRDIEATVNHLVEAGIADPDRIGIMGGSYGGYMVMAGLTKYPEMFAAGANLFGVVNFETFFANTEPWMAAISTVEYGDPATEAEMLRDLSPIHRVDEVVAPTIVLHGANDTNVPVVEAEQVVESLESRGVPVKYVLFPDEGHGWRKTANRITSDVEIVTWFEMHL